MPEICFRSIFSVSNQSLFDWHCRPGAFERLRPPWESIQLIRREGGIRDGGILEFYLKKGPIQMKWTALHRDYIENQQFVDEQIKGPFKQWVHTHLFQAINKNESELIDQIDFEMPLGEVGNIMLPYMESNMEKMFQFRHTRLMQDIARHKQFDNIPSKKIAVSGSSGLVGNNLCAFLQTGGYPVVRIVRNQPDESSPDIYWNLKKQELDTSKLENVDTVIHLAGENIFGLWTKQKKKRIRDSRVEGTALLANHLAKMEHPPKTLICASAIGIYGNRGNEELSEDSVPGEGFLADVCQEWEAATQPVKDSGIRVVHLRLGVVMTALGGALKTMLPAFKLGIAGKIGDGEQYMSWISLDDLIGLIQFCIHHDDIEGVVNAVAPNSVTNYELTNILGELLNRPTVIPAPKKALELFTGKMGQEMLLASARVLPQVAQEKNFEFYHSQLKDVIRFELGLLDKS